jgi:hypothetical protein
MSVTIYQTHMYSGLAGAKLKMLGLASCQTFMYLGSARN